MRLISSDTYSFGEAPYAWFGLLDPKLYQRYTWLLFPTILTPVVISVTAVGALGTNITQVSSKEVSVVSYRRKFHVTVQEPSYQVSTKRNSTSLST